MRVSGRYWEYLVDAASKRKKLATSADEKNKLWFIKSFATGTKLYLQAYHQLRRGKYFDSWCTLEQAELAFARQLNNEFIPELLTLVEQRANLIALWQSTFPYRHFASPGMILKRWACSICGKQSTPISPCGHVLSRVYDGELCFRNILELEPIEISIVTDPVQKFSALQLDYDYSVVRYVLEHLSGPFHSWSGEWTYKRQSHAHFIDRPPEEPCPCDSKLRYSECCLRTEGVRLPHFQIAVAGVTRRSQSHDRVVLHTKNE